MKKRILSLLLALALLCALLPAAGVSAAGFTDVDKHSWYYEGVSYAVTNELMNGVGNGKFNPEGNMTRAMLVTVLWRYTGSPWFPASPFRDVPSGQWYTDAVSWASANEIVSGVSPDKFDPNGNITREQMAAILYRYANRYHMNTSAHGSIYSFVDGSTVHDYAREAFSWAIGARIINGVSSELLLPQGNATRAQVATILMRFIEGTEVEICEHEWREATCFAPKFCLKCGQSKGGQLTHSVDPNTQKCIYCGYQIFNERAVLYSFTQDYAMGGGCSMFFLENHEYHAVAGGSSIYVDEDGNVPETYAGEENVRTLVEGTWYYDSPYLVCSDGADGTDKPVYIYVGDTPDPTHAKYERYLYGEWYMKGAYDAESGQYLNQSELNVVGRLYFSSDHTVNMTVGNTSAIGLAWTFLYVDEDGDYLYYMYDETGYADFYYIVTDAEVWLILGSNILVFEK